MSNSPAVSIDSAVAAHKAGQFKEAETAYRTLLAFRPEDPDVNNLLGVLLQQTGRLGESRARLERVTARNPEMAIAHNNLGITLQAEGDLDGAMRAYARATEIAPAYAEARHNIALLATDLRDYARAEAELIAALQHAPHMPELYLALGNVHLDTGRLSLALAAYQRLLDLDPGHVIGHNNVGMVFSRLGLPLAAIPRFDRSLALDPTYAEARWNRARQRLTLGHWTDGWADFEARREAPKFLELMYQPGTPVWRGEPLEGKTLLLHAEQGRGDSIQFVRWARLCADRGAQVILDVEADLVALFETHDPRIKVVARSANPPKHDLNCPLPSLPHRFQATEATLPPPPYLGADPLQSAAWSTRLPTKPGMLRVGLVWAGNPEFPEDAARSPRLAPFLPLLSSPGVQFFGFQVGDGRRDLEEMELPDSFVDLGGEFRDFADTAAAMVHMDLIISSCTSPAHLAGALGLPLWAALSWVPDWRWIRGRDDTPWYPQARLFRQTSPGDWASVVAAMAVALRELKPR